MRTNKSSLHAPCCARASKTMAAAEDDVLKKPRRAAASGVGASGRLSAERVQTVLRHARGVLLSYERSYGTDDFLNDTFQDMKCFEFEVNRFSSGVLGVDTRFFQAKHFSPSPGRGICSQVRVVLRNPRSEKL